jgi:hypothetical protein
MINREPYPYSLDRLTERVFLVELANVLDVALWRADEIEACAREIRSQGVVSARDTEAGWWLTKVSASTRLLGSIEGFLGAWARASLILYPIKKAAQARGEHLRSALGIRHRDFSAPLRDRTLRDGWMHLDEDLDKWSAERKGDVLAGAISRANEKWYDLAQCGAVRIADVEDLAVALPLRGVWLLRPFFHQCKELRDRVRLTLDDADRWICCEGVCGLAVGWAGEPQTWTVRSLGSPIAVTVEGTTYPEVERGFIEAVRRMTAAAS